MAHIVSEAQAKAVLAELRPWLRDRPPIGPFRDQLEAIVEPIWAIRCAAGHYHAVGMALRKLRLPVRRAKTVLRAMEESATSPEMVNYADLLKLNVMGSVRHAVIELDLILDRVPPAFSGRHRPGKGPAPRAWYFGFVRDLQESPTDSALSLRSASAVGLTTRTRPLSPGLCPPSKSCCRATRNRPR